MSAYSAVGAGDLGEDHVGEQLGGARQRLSPGMADEGKFAREAFTVGERQGDEPAR